MQDLRSRTLNPSQLGDPTPETTTSQFIKIQSNLMPDEPGNYSKDFIKGPVGNNDRCSLLKCVTPNTIITYFSVNCVTST